MRSRRWFAFGVLTPSILLASALAAMPPASAEPAVQPTAAEILRTAEGVAGPAEVDVDRIPGGIEADLPGGLAEVTAEEMSIDADGVPEVTLGLPTVGAGQVVGEALAADGVHESVAATHRLADRLLTPNGNLVYGLTSSGVCAVLAATVAGGLACGFVYAAGMYALERQRSQADRNGRCFTLSTPPRGTFGSVSRSNSRCHAR